MPVPRRTKRSQRQEREGAARFGGRVVAGSGAGWVNKNDVKADGLSIEYKYTDKKSYSIKKADLLRAEKNALLDSGREFAFIVGFGEVLGHSNFRVDREFVVVSREYFESLRNQHGHPE